MSKSAKSVKTQTKKKTNPRVVPQSDMLIDLVREMLHEEGESLNLDGTEDVRKFQEYSIDDEEHHILVSEDDIAASRILHKSAYMSS